MEKRADDLKKRGLALLASPAAFMLPKPVRDLIADLLALVADLARGKS